MTERNPTIAQWCCYLIGVEFLALLGLDLWLAKTGRQMITEAARDDNDASGWIVGGVLVTIVFHLLFLRPLQNLWRRFLAR